MAKLLCRSTLLLSALLPVGAFAQAAPITQANPIQITTAFSNTASDRPYQDVGLDGMWDTREQTWFAGYVTTLKNEFGGLSADHLR